MLSPLLKSHLLTLGINTQLSMPETHTWRHAPRSPHRSAPSPRQGLAQPVRSTGALPAPAWPLPPHASGLGIKFILPESPS